jgi:hypothetical protein
MGKIITAILIYIIFSQISVFMHGASPNPGYFSIANFTHVMSSPTITITSPNGGENLVGGTTYTIRWTSSQTFDSIDIEYYNGTQWKMIVYGTQDDGSYSWLVPNISTTNARLWIKGWSSGGNPSDYSDNTFTISKFSGSITVTSPNGGEVWVAGSTQNITWYSSGNVGNVKILYSTDGGYNWITIITSTSNDGTYAWTLPNVSSSNCLIRIRGYTKSNIPQRIYPDNNGMINIEITELERVELHFDTETGHFVDKSTAVRYEGYLVVDHLLRPLPPGSTLDTARGIFCWQPGPGFLGEYRFIFLKTAQNREERKDIKVKIFSASVIYWGKK